MNNLLNLILRLMN